VTVPRAYVVASDKGTIELDGPSENIWLQRGVFVLRGTRVPEELVVPVMTTPLFLRLGQPDSLLSFGFRHEPEI